MAGLNYVLTLKSIADFINEDGEVRDLLGHGDLLFEIAYDHNAFPYVVEIIDRSSGQNVYFDGPAKGYIGVSLKKKNTGWRDYVISIGTPERAYSVPFARWAVGMVEEGVGLLRADKEADLEGEAAEIHAHALSLPQMGLNSDLSPRDTERGRRIACAVKDAEEHVEMATEVAPGSFAQEELRQAVAQKVYADKAADIEEVAWAEAIEHVHCLLAEARQMQNRNQLPKVREQRDALWSRLKKAQERIEELESELLAS